MRHLIFTLVLLLSVLILPVMASEEIPFNSTISGDRNIEQVYTWQVQNVSGLADIGYHFEVYDYRDLGSNYTYWSKAWGKWEKHYATPGTRFIAVWVNGWTEGTTWIGWGPDRFNMWIWGNTTIKPLPTHLQDMPITYGSERYRPVVIAELENRTRQDGSWLPSEWYGFKDGQELDRAEPGLSNSVNGFILYEVPVIAKIPDLRVAGWFGYYGTAIWYLTPQKIIQNSFERIQADDIKLIQVQKEIGLRVSDSITRGKG
ncbi:hypothetical protein [Methanoregula sp.]|uniref:hypothetical protein n=1 Tax=Methanoregula sp. TaxID=2052170 RepID=UPI003565BB5B